MNRRNLKKTTYDILLSRKTGKTQEKSYMISEQCLQCEFGVTSCEAPVLCRKHCDAGLAISEKIRLGSLCSDYRHF